MAGVTYILRLRDQASKTARKVKGALDRTTAAAQKTADSFNVIGLAAGGIAVAGLFKMGAELEQTNLLFNTLTGSVEKGTKLFEDLTEFANATPFSNQALNKNAQVLLSFGQKSEGVVDTLRMLGDIAGGDQERLKSLTLAFAQSQTAGKLMGQDLLQMINVGFNPLQEISEKTGVSMADLKKQMSKGAISADLVRKAFQSATAKGGRFHNLTNDMAKTMSGKWSTALGKSKFLVAELGLSMKGLFAPFIDGITKAIDFLSEHRRVVFPVLQALTIFTGVIIGIVITIKAWIVVQTVINALLIANPIGLVIVAVAALIAGITTLWQKSEGFRRVLLGTWEVIKLVAGAVWNFAKKAITPLVNGFKKLIGPTVEAAKALKEKFFGSLEDPDSRLSKFTKSIKEGVVESFKQLVSALGNVGKAIKAFFSGDFEEAAEFSKKAFENFQGKGIVDVEFAKKAGKKIADAFRVGAEKAKRPEVLGIEEPGFGGVGGEFGGLGLSDEVKKLQAEGVVSGGIKSFNITIQTLTGIESLTTNNIQEGAEAAGRAVQNALFGALADIKNV